MGLRNVVRPMFRIPVTSTLLLNDPHMLFSGASASLPLRCELDGVELSVSVKFEKVRAFRHRAEILCTTWHLNAYDTVSAVDDSDWVKELSAASQESPGFEFVMNHYLIFLADSGAFEVVAESAALESPDSLAVP